MAHSSSSAATSAMHQSSHPPISLRERSSCCFEEESITRTRGVSPPAINQEIPALYAAVTLTLLMAAAIALFFLTIKKGGGGGRVHYVDYSTKKGVVFPHKKQRAEDAGFDLPVSGGDMTIPAWGTTTVETGVRFKIRSNRIMGTIIPRSSFAAEGLSVAANVIDSGYNGYIKIIATNLSSSPIHLTNGSRISQIVFQKRPQICLITKSEKEIAKKRSGTSRGEEGFGSTGR